MPNSVIVGPLRGVAPGRITLGGNLHIVVPDGLLDREIPLGTSLTVIVHEREDGLLIAESVTVRSGSGFLS
jgi:hypothetical protein